MLLLPLLVRLSLDYFLLKVVFATRLQLLLPIMHGFLSLPLLCEHLLHLLTLVLHIHLLLVEDLRPAALLLHRPALRVVAGAVLAVGRRDALCFL